MYHVNHTRTHNISTIEEITKSQVYVKWYTSCIKQEMHSIMRFWNVSLRTRSFPMSIRDISYDFGFSAITLSLYYIYIYSVIAVIRHYSLTRRLTLWWAQLRLKLLLFLKQIILHVCYYEHTIREITTPRKLIWRPSVEKHTLGPVSI